MLENQQERQQAEAIANAGIELLREQLEFYREIVESLKLERLNQKQELQELEQELAYTNRNLCDALKLERVCLEEAKALAKTILKSKKSVSKSISELLSAIYHSPVRLEELEHIDKS